MENFDDKYKKEKSVHCTWGVFDELTGRITGRIEKQKEVKKFFSSRVEALYGLSGYFLSCFNGGSDSISRSEEYWLAGYRGGNAIVQEMEAEDIFDSQFNPTNEEIIEYLASK